MENMKVLVVAGSSGGHIFPAVALLEYLKQKDSQTEVLLVLPKRSIGKNIGAFGFKTAYIDSVNIELKINYRNLTAVFKFFKCACQSLFIILRFEPEVVIGFGSIVSIPLVMLGWLMRLKVVLHEQNVIPGKANRFLAKFCGQIAVSFERTRGYLKGCSSKVVFTGNPLRGNLTRVNKEKCREFFALEENKLTLLVMGGSQGSLRLNRGFLRALAVLPGRENIQVIHLTGSNEQIDFAQEYSDIKIKARIFPFLNEMEYALSLTDLAVCRAGAVSIQELIHYQLPAVLLPYPFADQHQMANARVLEEKGAAVILEDKELDSDKLKNILQEILTNPGKLEKMRLGYGSFKPGAAAKHLAELVMDRNTSHG